MFPSSKLFSSSLPQDLIIGKLHYSRRLLLHTPLYHSLLTPPPAPTPDTQLDPSSIGSTSFDANVVLVLSVLLCALICSLCVNTLIKCMLKSTSLISQLGPSDNYLLCHEKVISSGVDKRALKTFSVVKYSKEEKNQGLDTECVICLSDFLEGEKVRILPKCNHGFHLQCIDKWLSSHTSCPTCRQSLVDTCQKILGCDDEHDQANSSSVTVPATEDRISVTVVPLEREHMVRNYWL